MPSTIILGASAVLLLAYIIRAILFQPKKLDFPIVGNPDDVDFRTALLEGTAKTRVFFINQILSHSTYHSNLHQTVSYNPLYPPQQLSNSCHPLDGISKDSEPIIKAVKIDLKRHVASTLEFLQEESRFALDQELGTCENWTQITVHRKILKIIARLSGRVFVGIPLSQTEKSANISTKFTEDVVLARQSVAKYPAWLRSFVIPFLSEIKKVKQHKVVGAELWRPIIEGRIQRSREGEEGNKDNKTNENQGTAVSWIMKWSNEKKKDDVFALAEYQLGLSFAAIHTTGTALTHILFDLAAHPQFIAPLRKESDQVLAEDGWEDDGSGIQILTNQSLPKLKKRDSLLKESQRFSPIELVFNIRSTTSPIRLSTGETIPTGTRITFDVHTINTSGPNVSSIPHNPSSIPALDPPEIFSIHSFISPIFAAYRFQISSFPFFLLSSSFLNSSPFLQTQK
ncbi:hypothetical protein EAF00_009294 [Botryotinia globosa]|nr:hypothetical protein EAF00_009294 [Botryotinia globosa]